jgi:hypothetical protein
VHDNARGVPVICAAALLRIIKTWKESSFQSYIAVGTDEYE